MATQSFSGERWAKERALFLERGWIAFNVDPAIASWARAARPIVDDLIASPTAERRCGGTWLPGVHCFPNDEMGAIPARQIPTLAGGVVEFVRDGLELGDVAWDQAQISVAFPGYPRRGVEETEAAFRYRSTHDAAHVDGLLREPPARNRRIGEAHGFILGIPIDGVAATGASSMVVWERSHEVMRAALLGELAGVPAEDWPSVDVTKAYHAARKRCFETCRRVIVSAPVGGAYVLHRLSLHGVAPWTADRKAPPRAIIYFRPNPFPKMSFAWWLDRP